MLYSILIRKPSLYILLLGWLCVTDEAIDIKFHIESFRH